MARSRTRAHWLPGSVFEQERDPRGGAILSGVPDVVDPTPIIRARLDGLAAELQPRIDELERALPAAPKEGRNRLEAELRAVRRDYARARRRAQELLGPGVAW